MSVSPSSWPVAGGGFQGADAGGADRDHAARGSDRGGGFRRDAVVLGVQLRLFDHLLVQRLKGAEAYVEGDVRLFGAGCAAAVQHLRREVKPGGRRRDGASFAGEDGLVALAVGGRIGALDVGRQGHVADALEGGVEIPIAVKADGAFAEFRARDDLAFQPFVEAYALADRHLAAGAHQRLPIAAVGGNAAQQEDFDGAAQVFVALGVVLADGQRVHSGAMAEEARGEDARIVEHQAIARVEELRQVAKRAVFPAAPSRWTTSMREAARSARASCAISSSGRW